MRVAQSCPTLYDLLEYTVHGILYARILEWLAFPFSRGSSQPRDQTQLSHIAGVFFTSWATVSSRSCFCWLYRPSPPLAAKNIISLISVLTIWWCPCVESSPVLLEEGVCYDQCVLLAKLYQPLPCVILYSKAKSACYSRCFLTSYFCIPVLWLSW